MVLNIGTEIETKIISFIKRLKTRLAEDQNNTNVFNDRFGMFDINNTKHLDQTNYKIDLIRYKSKTKPYIA